MDPRSPDDAFVLEHSGFVRELAHALVFDADLARDVEQQTWLAALRHAPRESGSARSWLAAVVRNNAYQLFRGRRHRAEREEAVAPREDRGEGDSAAPEEWLAREELRREIVSAVSGLDEPWRTTLIRRYFDELTPQQVAERMGVPLETVRSRLKRAHVLLRERLERRSGRSSLALSLALVEAWRLSPPAGEGLVAGVAASLTQWSLVMGAAHKLGAAAAVVVLTCIGVWWATRDDAARGPQTPAQYSDVERAFDEARAAPRAREVGERSEAVELAQRAPSSSPQSPASPALAPSEGSLELEFVWASDGLPAADVGALLVQAGAADRQMESVEVRSDARGLVFVERLRAGLLTIQLDRGGAQLANVPPQARGRERIELKDGVRLHGRTLDSSGRPVAGAQIVLHSGLAPDLGGFAVARSDAAGAYEVRGVSLDFGPRLAARAEGYGPSRQVLLPQRAESKDLHADLVLGERGGALRGRVVDIAGAPVAGALVVLGHPEDREMQLGLDGRHTLAAGLARARTAADGSFELRSVAPGRAPLLVRARGFAALRSELSIDGESVAPDFVLQRATRVFGSVRDDAGAPVFDAKVSIGRASELSACETRSREDGSFELDSAPAEEFEIAIAHDSRGRASARLAGAPGANLEWHAVLSLGRVLRVRVEAPAAKLRHFWVRVDARASGASYFRVLTPDGEGRVAFPDCPAGPLHLELVDTLTNADAPCAVYPELFADGIEVAVRPDPALVPGASVRGRVVDRRGVGIGGARVSIDRTGDGPLELHSESDGTFRSPALPALRYTLAVEAEGYAARRGDAFELALEQQLDLGELVLERPAGLVARVRRGPGVTADPRWVVLTGADGRELMLDVLEGVARSGPLAPGRYSVRGADRNAAVAPLEIELAEEELRELELDAQLGAEVLLSVETPAGERPNATIDFVLRQGSALVRNGRFSDDAPARFVTRLLPGEYEFIVGLDDGRSARLALEVDARGIERKLVID